MATDKKSSESGETAQIAGVFQLPIESYHAILKIKIIEFYNGEFSFDYRVSHHVKNENTGEEWQEVLSAKTEKEAVESITRGIRNFVIEANRAGHKLSFAVNLDY